MAVQRACECSHGRRRWARGLAWVQLTWLGCVLALCHFGYARRESCDTTATVSATIPQTCCPDRQLAAPTVNLRSRPSKGGYTRDANDNTTPPMPALRNMRIFLMPRLRPAPPVENFPTVEEGYIA